MRLPKFGRFCLSTAALSTFAVGSAARADESIVYTYDARGRLVMVTRSGTINNGVQANYSFDNADNRVNVTVSSGSATPSFAINSASSTEGGQLTLIVTRSGATTSLNSVSFATSDGTALAGSDYSASVSTLSFQPGDTSKAIIIATIDDNSPEGSEAFYVNLSAATGGSTISQGQGTGTIIDNDTVAAPTPTNPTLTATTGVAKTYLLTTLATFTGGASLMSFAPPTGSGSAVIASDRQSVTYTPPALARPANCEPAYVIRYSIPYMVQASPNGPSANGMATMDVSSLPGLRTKFCTGGLNSGSATDPQSGEPDEPSSE